MSRIYCSVILNQPQPVTVGNRTLTVAALQVPIHTLTQPELTVEMIDPEKGGLGQLGADNHRRVTEFNQSITDRFSPDAPQQLLLGPERLPLELKFSEEHGNSGVHTLVYDEPELIPTQNFRNDALNAAGFQAVCIAPEAPPELAAELRVALQTAGPGHWGRLLRLQGQAEIDFIIDKLSVIYPYLSRIKDDEIRGFVTRAILESFTEFFIGPSSTGGKYHPADEVVLQGLAQHTKRVAEVALKLGEALELPQAQRDEILAAALLHDICKSVTRNKESGDFKWEFHSVDDHSVIGAKWLEEKVVQGSPTESIRRVMRSVYYHSNIWTPNVDTALTAENPLNDWIVSLADIVAGLKNVRVHFPGEPVQTREEVVNDLLSRPFDLGIEKFYADWAEYPPAMKKAVYLAEQLFVQYQINGQTAQQRVLNKIEDAAESPEKPAKPANLAADRSAFIVYVCRLIPHLPGIDIYMREDIDAVMAGVERPQTNWHVPKAAPTLRTDVAARLQKLFFEDREYEAWPPLKARFLELLNRRVGEAKIVKDEELDDKLLLALMLKFGTLDIDEIYHQVYGMWAERDQIRERLKSRDAALDQLEEIYAESEYSDAEIGRVEEGLSQRLNETLGDDAQQDKLKPLDESIAAMLQREFGSEVAERIIADIQDADSLASPRYKPKTAVSYLRRLAGVEAEKLEKVRTVLTHELEYRQRNPFNRMNRDILGWLMQRYKTSDPEELFRIIYQNRKPARQRKIVAALQKYEAQTRKLENEHLTQETKGGNLKKSVPIKERNALLASAKAELEPWLPAERTRVVVDHGKIAELEDMSSFALRHQLEASEQITGYLDGARNEAVVKDYHDLPGIEPAKDLVMEKLDRIDQGERIVVYGDYDADGIMGTVILVTCLREVAAQMLRARGTAEAEIQRLVEQNIQFYIPDRRRGYGLSNQSVEELIDQGATTVITTDNGVGGKAEITHAREYARDKGKAISIVVTDHHAFALDAEGENIDPGADALVHPRLLEESHPLRYLAGAAVAYEFACALYDAAGLDMGDKLIEYAAIATITDVVPMPKGSINRAIARFGFRKFGAIYARLQAAEEEEKQALLAADRADGEEGETADIETSFDDNEFGESGLSPGLYLLCKLLRINAFDRDKIGFGLGPALNAVGRIAEASLAVELLLAKTKEEALPIAERLIAYNEQRKEIQAKITEEALEQLARMIQDGQYDPETTRAVVLADDNWHAGVVGIVASHIAEEIGGTAAVGTGTSGSMRTIPGMHILETLRRAIELYQADGHRGSFFEKYGGHSDAAGYRLKEDRLQDFRTYLARAAGEKYGKERPVKTIPVDIEQPLERVSLSQLQVLEQFAPFGRQTFGKTDEVPRPTFASRRVKVINWSPLGAHKQHLEITFEDDRGRQIKGVWFRSNNLASKRPLWNADPAAKIRADITYKLDCDYRGDDAQLIIEDLQAAA